MSCSRFADIHVGQRMGKNSSPCDCNCHVSHHDRKPKFRLYGDWYCNTCLSTHSKNQVCSA